MPVTRFLVDKQVDMCLMTWKQLQTHVWPSFSRLYWQYAWFFKDPFCSLFCIHPPPVHWYSYLSKKGFYPSERQVDESLHKAMHTDNADVLFLSHRTTSCCVQMAPLHRWRHPTRVTGASYRQTLSSRQRCVWCHSARTISSCWSCSVMTSGSVDSRLTSLSCSAPPSTMTTTWCSAMRRNSWSMSESETTTSLGLVSDWVLSLFATSVCIRRWNISVHFLSS